MFVPRRGGGHVGDGDVCDIEKPDEMKDRSYDRDGNVCEDLDDGRRRPDGVRESR